MSGFSAYTGKDAGGAVCLGAHHSDYATLGRCDKCGQAVAKTEKGHLAPVSHSPGTGARRFACWTFHECNTQYVEWTAVEDAKALLAGEVRKGVPVVVFKGRKVPVGTKGVVRWDNPYDAYGHRIGIAVEGEQKLVYLAAANVKVDADEEQLAGARAQVEAWDAKHQAWDDALSALQAEVDASMAEQDALWARLEAAPVEDRKALYEAEHDAMNARITRLGEIEEQRKAIKEERGW